MKKIGITILATNSYFVLGVRFIRKFLHYYKGNQDISFYFFSNRNPIEYLPEGVNLKFVHTEHTSWVDATNSKFGNIISLKDEDIDYIYYFDADTNIDKIFDENWFLGEIVGGEHFGNRSWLANGAGYDKNPKSKAFVPPDSNLPKIYYYGAFFGGEKNKIIDFCETLRSWQLEDKKIPYEPGVNDESYINAYFHFNSPKLVTCENFMFNISDKGGIGETRDVNLNVSTLIGQIKRNKDKLYDIQNGRFIVLN